MRRLLIISAVLALAAVPLASAAARHATAYPKWIAVLGTPTAAGENIYSRLLAADPAVKGHNGNFANGEGAPEAAGHELEDFAGQVHVLLRQKVKPDLVLVQVIDRAMKCDGTTERNFADYGAKF